MQRRARRKRQSTRRCGSTFTNSGVVTSSPRDSSRAAPNTSSTSCRTTFSTAATSSRRCRARRSSICAAIRSIPATRCTRRCSSTRTRIHTICNELADYYIGYRTHMDHWHRVLPGRILDVSYEEFVRDPESQARRVLDWCGLPWQASVLEFHAQERPSMTASAMQVRRPIYTHSIGAWRRSEAGPCAGA